MSRFKYFSIARLSGRIFWSFMLLSLVALASGIISNILLSQSDSTNAGINLYLDEYNQAVLLNSSLENMAAVVSEMVLNNQLDPASFYQNYYRKASDELANLGQLVAKDDNSNFKSLFQNLSSKYATANKAYASIVAATATGQTAQIQQVFNQTASTRSALKEAINSVVADRREFLNNSQNEDASFVADTRWTNLGLAFFSFLLAIILALLVTRRFVRPIEQLTQKLRLVADGDLTEQFEVRGHDEIAELSTIFNRTIASLKLTIARIQSQSNAISGTSHQISVSSVNQASSLSEQAIAVSQVSATIEELSGTSQQIATVADKVATSATNALTSAHVGYDTTLAADQTMAEIRFKVNQIADRILALNVTAQRIRDITKLIDNIANETHLLALNAAIESAGAGEEGQRFGVVASNVRKLAHRSRIATIEIQQLINQIQQATTASVMATEEGMKTVVTGEQMLRESLQAQTLIIEQAMQTNELANAISLATNQQCLGSQQVSGTMRELSRIINDISVGSQQYRASASDLTNVVVQLNSVATAFVLDKPRTAKLGTLTTASKAETEPLVTVGLKLTAN